MKDKDLSTIILGLPWWLRGKNLPANAGDAGDMGLIPGSGRSPRGGNGSILAWKIPWTEESGGLQSIASQKGQTQLSN